MAWIHQLPPPFTCKAIQESLCFRDSLLSFEILINVIYTHQKDVTLSMYKTILYILELSILHAPSLILLYTNGL